LHGFKQRGLFLAVVVLLMALKIISLHKFLSFRVLSFRVFYS